MRTLLLLLAIVGVGLNLGGQGVLGFNNTGASPEQKVYIDDWLNPAALAPGGTQFMVALYFARPEDGESALTQLGGPAGFLGDPNRGVFYGNTRTIAGYIGLFQVKGWESKFGSTYEEAAANPAARVGQSAVFTANGAFPGEPASSLIVHSFGTFRGFVIAVPEPSTLTLAFGGSLTALFALHRRSSRRP